MDYAVLKPVNEYNIVDKIKEANKVLFALEGDDDDVDEDAANAANGGGRKVTFALNLEDYEPTTQQANAEQQQQLQETGSPPDELLQQLAQLKLKPDSERFAPIAEEPASEQENLEEAPQQQEQQQLQQEETLIKELQVEEEMDEEICEEILDLSEVENVKPPQPAADVKPPSMDYEDDDDFSGVDEDDLTAASETLAADTQKRRISRQNTFDLNHEQDDGESDQRSLTNLLTESDCEEDERAVNEARLKLRHAYKSLYKTLDAKQQAQINRLTAGEDEDVDQDQDDDLSIIVASYIPDDFELNERSIYYKKDGGDEDEQKLRSSPCRNTTSSSTSTKTFFNARRFSFRRRARPTPSATGTCHAAPEVKMNYKICCEHRHALQEKLPKYTGYMSEYGLSAKQLQQREQQLRRKQRFTMEQALNRNEHELKKMQDNERAFTTWLKNKMRYPINKTRNMFDTTRRRASVAAAVSSPGNPRQQQQQQKQQSASRLRRDSNSEVHVYRHLLGSWNK